MKYRLLLAVLLSMVSLDRQGDSVFRQQQELPTPRPHRVRLAWPLGPNVAQWNGYVSTTQEQPYHPKPFAPTTRNLVPPPAPPPGIFTRQELPGHPLPWKWDALGYASPAPVLQRSTIIGQQFPDLGRVLSGIGIQGPDVRPPVEDSAIIPQERPREGVGVNFSPGVQVNADVPFIGRLWVGEERPREGYSWVRHSIPGPDVIFVPPITSSLFAKQQEYPPPGKGIQFSFGRQGPNVASGIGSIYLRQEAPRHPAPFTWNFMVTPPGAPIPATNLIFTRQEMLGNGRVLARTSRQGPNVRPGVRDTLVSRAQEQPYPGAGYQHRGIPGISKTPQTISSSTFPKQQIPAQASYRTWFSQPGPDVAPNNVQQIYVRQERPEERYGLRTAYFYVPQIFAPVSNGTISVFVPPQQLPVMLRRVKFSPGVQGPDVQPPNQRIIQGQEVVAVYWAQPPFVYYRFDYLPRDNIYRPGNQVITRQELPFHPGFFSRGVDIPNNAWPFFTGKIPPLQENLTKDMLGKNRQEVFYADPGFDRQVITSINYPQGQYYVVGWTPIGGVKYPIGNMYNRDMVIPERPPARWFGSPDIVGGWITEHQNLTRDMVSLSNQTDYFVEPVQIQVNDLTPQLYPTGLTPIGLNITRRGMLGVKPYG